MPVATAEKVQALSRDFRSQRRLAELLGVSPAPIGRWQRGQGIDPVNADRVDLLEHVMSGLLRIYAPDAAERWLTGLRPATRRPATDRPGRLRARPRAVGCAGGRARRRLRVIVHRALPLDRDAPAAGPGGALWFPRALQGAGRHDNPDRYGCLYVSQEPHPAIAEPRAPFRRHRGPGAVHARALRAPPDAGRPRAFRRRRAPRYRPAARAGARAPGAVAVARALAPSHGRTQPRCTSATPPPSACAGGRFWSRAGCTSRCSIGAHQRSPWRTCEPSIPGMRTS